MSYSSRHSGPPGWFVFLVGVAFVFGLYYLWRGVSDFIVTGGMSIAGATEQAEIIATSTAVREIELATNAPTRRPTSTPLPDCQPFRVNVPSAIVRERPSTASGIVDTFERGTEVCVLVHEGDWYRVDSDPITRRIETAYMHQDIVEALNPTPTPSRTWTPAPTITPTPSPTTAPTSTTAPTATPDPNATPSPTPTPSRTPTWTPSFTPPAVSI